MFTKKNGHFGGVYLGVDVDGFSQDVIVDNLVEELIKIKLVSTDERLDEFVKDLEKFLEERADHYGVQGYVS